MNSQQHIGVRFLVFSIILMMPVSAIFIGPNAQSASLPGQNFQPLPVYHPGTTFVYSDGTWETVIAAEPNVVSWKDHRGNTSTGTPDFTRRRLQYQTKTRQGARVFGPRENIIVKHRESIWPLEVGKKASFTERGTWVDKRDGSEHAYRAHWSCEVEGAERIVVPAGEFDTWKIVCSRYASSRNARSQLREIKTWYYAPQIGHFVLSNSRYFYNQSPRQLELLAVLPPKESLPSQARRKMDNSFQKAMEHQKSGSSVVWSIANPAASGGITPYGTFKLEDGTFCRRYVQNLNLSGADQQAYYGLACRDAGGRWDIPRR